MSNSTLKCSGLRASGASSLVAPASCLRAFSLIEMMIAIVILGLGLVMTATMFPVAWTRARTLTEYTTQRVVAQSAAATISESLRPSGSSFTPYVNAAGDQTGKFFISGGSLAGDLFYDPVLHSDSVYRAPCDTATNQCFTHLSVLIPSDTRVHALHMENLNQGVAPFLVPEQPFRRERIFELCDTAEVPSANDPAPRCVNNYPDGNFPAKCAKPDFTGFPNGVEFCARSFYSPQVSLGARMYPPMDAPPANTASPAFQTWLEKFGTRRYTWAALHRLPKPVGPSNVPPPPDPLSVAESRQFASEAASAAGTTRTFDFYVVTLKRPQSTSRYALQDPATTPNKIKVALASVAALGGDQDVVLPVAWRVQIEIPQALASKIGGGSGVQTEVQVPPTGVSGASALMMVGMFPAGTQFVDEVNGQVFRVVRRRLNALGNTAFLTLDRELSLQDFDDSLELDPTDVPYGGNGTIDAPAESLRTVWVYPPPVVRDGGTVLFDDASPVVGIDIRSISMTPPG